jgi:transcriptional regulator with XRE-family HTH domain
MASQKNILVRFGARIRQLRQKRGYSQEAFADQCGLDRTYISGIERGRRNVSIRNIEIIAKTLELDLSELFSGV